MLNIPHSQDWEQLWYYGKLDNNTFLEKLKSVHIPKHTCSLSGSLLGYKTIP